MDAEAAYHVQTEKLEDQLRSAAEVKVCMQALTFFTFTSMAKDANSGQILLLSFRTVKCISLISAKTSDQNYGIKKYWHC